MALRIRSILFGFLLPHLPVVEAEPDRVVNVRSFKNLVKGKDWSAAIQAAIDSVNRENGYEAGGTVLFPAGSYQIDRSIVLGEKPAHWGLHLLGYGATIIGSKVLDKQQLIDPEPEEKDKGVPILVLKDPKGNEGASYCIEGLRLKREQRSAGVGISVPWKEVPKNVSFRNLKIHDQKVGVHIKYAWQFSFQDCLFRGNDTGMILQSHGNNVGIVNCIFRRQNYDGLVVGPDRGQWGSNGYHISGSIFESNKGYGILLRSAAQVKVSGNYFEANGNSVGVFTPYGEVSIDTNLFWGHYGHGWQRGPYADQAQVVLSGTGRVQLRNNKYAGSKALFRRKEGKNLWEYVPFPKGPSGVPNDKVKKPKREKGFEYEERLSGIFIAGGLSRGLVFDTLPAVHHKALSSEVRAAAHTGLSYYEYDLLTNTFAEKSLIKETAEEISKREERTREAFLERLESAQTVDDRAWTRVKIGHTWFLEKEYGKARDEYRKALKIPPPVNGHLRAAITMEIAKSYLKEGNYKEAVNSYTHALKIGPGGWRLPLARSELEKAKKLARQAD
ncbi:MAG: right-handed parallel beta-helix repeat-containing protein [Planctomycetota bacterium]|nr:right-handed parallel beta-helix repeat-containing protein [Planctomycetota bacterium]